MGARDDESAEHEEKLHACIAPSERRRHPRNIKILGVGNDDAEMKQHHKECS
jgi:hypothetical protein